MTETVIFILEIIGTVAFAWSGAMTAIKKGMDIFGVAILGIVTAVGGGVIRDLILGNTPPNTFLNPIFGVLAAAVALIAFIPFVRRQFLKHHRSYDVSMLVMDSLGLGIFTVVGVGVAYEAVEFNILLFAFVGVITGVGGGVLRDMMAGQTPYIFVKHFYACASLIGALLTIVLIPICGVTPAMLIGSVVIIILRFLAAHYRWSLPKAHELPEETDESANKETTTKQ